MDQIHKEKIYDDEKLYIAVDFSKNIDSPDELSDISKIKCYKYIDNEYIEVSGSQSLISGSSNVDSPYLHTWIESGSADESYKIKFQATTASGSVYSEYLFIEIKG